MRLSVLPVVATADPPFTLPLTPRFAAVPTVPSFWPKYEASLAAPVVSSSRQYRSGSSAKIVDPYASVGAELTFEIPPPRRKWSATCRAVSGAL
jgi:hypothetical protein